MKWSIIETHAPHLQFIFAQMRMQWQRSVTESTQGRFNRRRIRGANGSKRYVALDLQGLHQACCVESVWPYYDRCPPAIQSSQARRKKQAMRARPSISQTARVRTEQSRFSFSCVWANDRHSSSGEEDAAGSLDTKHQGARIKLPHMRLVVVHEKY